MALRFDITNFIATGASRTGVPLVAWEGAQQRFATAHAALERQHAAGTLGFLDLPANAAALTQVEQFADAASGRYRDVVVLGIGGSALGPLALRTALRPSGWNALGTSARAGAPRLHVLDNVDPRTIGALLASLDLRSTLFIVTSKSGGTAETMAQFLVVRDRMARVGLPLARHLVFVTDPARGALRVIAQRDSIPTLDVPSNVGGRFSVLQIWQPRYLAATAATRISVCRTAQLAMFLIKMALFIVLLV